MSSDEVETIDLYKTTPDERSAGTKLGGHTYTDDQGRLTVRLYLKDGSGERRIHVREGDTFEFDGQSWRVTKVHEHTAATRGRVATLTKVP